MREGCGRDVAKTLLFLIILEYGIPQPNKFLFEAFPSTFFSIFRSSSSSRLAYELWAIKYAHFSLMKEITIFSIDRSSTSILLFFLRPRSCLLSWKENEIKWNCAVQWIFWIVQYFVHFSPQNMYTDFRLIINSCFMLNQLKRRIANIPKYILPLAIRAWISFEQEVTKGRIFHLYSLELFHFVMFNCFITFGSHLDAQCQTIC